jgi:hypothetical protein
MASVRRIRLVRLRTLAYNRAGGVSGHPIRAVYRSEHVVIGPANHFYAWLNVVKESCTAMVFEYPAPCCVWFAEKKGCSPRGSRNLPIYSWATP